MVKFRANDHFRNDDFFSIKWSQSKADDVLSSNKLGSNSLYHKFQYSELPPVSIR